MEPELEADLLVQVNSEGWRRQSIQAPVPEIIDPVFVKTSQNARFLLSENERFRLVFVKTESINSGTDLIKRHFKGIISGDLLAFQIVNLYNVV